MTTMEILCPESLDGVRRVPAVGRCTCGTALELERASNLCRRCGLTWSIRGERQLASNDNLTHPFLVFIEGASEAFTAEQRDYLLGLGLIEHLDGDEPSIYVGTDDDGWLPIENAMRKFQ